MFSSSFTSTTGMSGCVVALSHGLGFISWRKTNRQFYLADKHGHVTCSLARVTLTTLYLRFFLRGDETSVPFTCFQVLCPLWSLSIWFIVFWNISSSILGRFIEIFGLKEFLADTFRLLVNFSRFVELFLLKIPFLTVDTWRNDSGVIFTRPSAPLLVWSLVIPV